MQSQTNPFMELRQLKYFAKAAETLNFSEAAKMLFITQSTLSQQIRRLENELGTQLFERNSHEVTLTEMGLELLPYAAQTISAANTCVDHIRDLQQLLTGTLNIGVTYSFSPILTETVIAFMKRYPQVKLNVFYKTMTELMVMLEKREVDFVLAFRPNQRNERIESHILFDNYLAAIVCNDHPLAKHKHITLEELENYDLALPYTGLQARNMFDAITTHSNRNFKIRVELNEVNILLKLIKAGNLVTILSEATVYNEPGITSIPIDVPRNEMKGCVHMLKNAYRKHSAQEFIKMLSESNAIRKRMHNWLK